MGTVLHPPTIAGVLALGAGVAGFAITDGVLHLAVRMTRAEAACLACARPARRVHSHYARALASLAWRGFAVQLDIAARRFYCDHPACPRAIFAERLGPLAPVGARRTTRQVALITAVGLALGGEVTAG